MASIRPKSSSPESSSSSLSPAVTKDPAKPDVQTPSPASSLSASKENLKLPASSKSPSRSPSSQKQPSPPLPPRPKRFSPQLIDDSSQINPLKENSPPKVQNPIRRGHLAFLRDIHAERIAEGKEEYCSTFYPTSEEDTDAEDMEEWIRGKQEKLRRERERDERSERLERGENLVVNGGLSSDNGNGKGKGKGVVREEVGVEDREECLLQQIEEIPFALAEADRDGDMRGGSRTGSGMLQVEVEEDRVPISLTREADETTPLLLQQPEETRKRKRDGGFGIGDVGGAVRNMGMVLYSPIALFVDVCFGIDEDE